MEYSDFPSYLGAGFIIGVLVFLAIIIAIYCLYLITLQNALKEVSPINQKMRPGQVWLLLIPIFGSIYLFFVAGYIADSIKAELQSRGQQVDGRPTYGIGMAFAITSLASMIPFIGSFVGIASLVCWIIHWVKVAEYKNRLKDMPRSMEGSAIFGSPVAQ